MGGHEPHCPRGDAQAEGSGVRSGLPHAGAGSFFIIFKEVLPNIIGPIITQVMFSIPTAIFTEAFLSFVGLGIPVPQCSLGSLISELYNSFTTHPYQIIPPIVVMSLLMLSFNLVADGLREALDPKMKSM